MNKKRMTEKLAMSLKDFDIFTKIIWKLSHDLASFSTLRSRKDLKAEKAPPEEDDESMPTYWRVRDIDETITKEASKRLNLSYTYIFTPSPISLIIISATNIPENASLIFSKVSTSD